MRRIEFPQCLWGQTARKDTCISGTVEGLEEFDIYGNGTCRHGSHAKLYGKDEKGRFRTREAQTYPPPLCKKLAELFIRTWKHRLDLGEIIDVNEFGVEEPEEEESEEYDIGERVPSPEVARNWDPIERWEEDARWAWKKTEHNNVLEARGILAVQGGSLGAGTCFLLARWSREAHHRSTGCND